MNAILKRVVSLILCFVLVVGYVPVSAFATESGETVTAETTDVTTAPIDVVSDEPEAPSESTEEPTDPSQETTAPTDAATAPTDATTAPTDATTAPTDAPTEPTDATTAPTEAPTVPTEPEEEDKTETSTGSAVTVVQNSGSATFGTTATAASTGEAKVTARTNTNTSTDYLFIATDRHENTSIIGNIINNMESDIGENELDYLGLGGDMVGSGNSHPEYDSSEVLSEVTGATSSLSATNVDIVAGIHDMNVTDDAGIVLPYQGGGAQIYKGDRFYVYGVEEYCISEDSNESNWSNEAKKFVDWANGDSIDKTMAIIVLSHYPLHSSRGDNDGAYYWHQALNTVATGSASGDSTVERNVVFFHGHNHTTENNKEYLSDVGATMSIQNGSSTKNEPIYYTYATAGYLNGSKDATLVAIDSDNITLTKYGTSSSTAMTTVSRVKQVTAPTLSSIAITTAPTKTAYTVGENLDTTGMVVTATYSDNTTETVTGYTVSAVDMTTAGTKTVTVTYEGKTATFEITVSEAEAEPTVNTVECWDSSGQVTVKATGLGLTAVTATNVTGDVAKEACDAVFTTNGYMAFDIALTGLVEGQSVEYSISVVPDLDITNLELYYIDENGGLIPVECKLTADELNNVYVEFITDKAGTFVYGSPAAPEGYVLTSLVLANIPTDVFLGTSLKLDETAEVTATYTKEGAEDFVRKLTIYDYGADNFSGIDVNVSGKQTATFTFEGVSVTHDIYVWGDSFTTSGVTVALDTANGSEYGVTGATIADSQNTNVATAIADVIDGDNYVAYDISLTYSENYKATTDTKTVTLPIPEGVTNPVVYYVSDDGQTVTNMEAAKTEDGKSVTFTTDHFSTYVVGESTSITVPDPETATGSGTIGGKETKTVYMLTDSITTGNEYLIVDTNSAGDANILARNGSSVSNTTGTVVSDSNGTYIVLNDVTDELWTYDTVTSGTGYWSEEYNTFKNGEYYLYYTGSSYDRTLALTTSTPSYSWTYSNNRLSIRSRYLNGGSSWSLNSNTDNVYFYVKDTIEVDTTTEVSGTYSIAGNPAEVSKVVTNGTSSTVTLGSTLTFVPTSGATTTTENPDGVTYTVVENGDPNGVISGITGNTVTLSGNYGKALVKVSKEVTFGTETKTVTNYIIVNATEPTYTLDITKGEEVVTGTTISEKGVTGATTLQLGTKVFYETAEGKTELETLPEGAKIEWHIPEEYQHIAVVDLNTGLVTFKGEDGAFYVTATLTVNGKDYTVGVNISATTSNYTVPSDGVSDFPEYPNEGAIRYDKTATAVGNFSETGIAQVELSMTGVPYTTGSEIDVVLMLDMTGSMDDVTSSTSEPTGYVRIDATIAASKAFIDTIVKNEDGSYNGNRIGVYVFNKNGAATLYDFGTVDSDTELNAIYADLESIKDDHFASGGTPYDDGLAKCQEVLAAAKTDGTGNNRQQFTVFMTDGVPTSYAYVNGSSYGTHSSASAVAGMLTSASNYATRDTDYKYEYYSTEMKKAGVTVYSVGVGLYNENNAWSGTATQCGNLASVLLNDISGPSGETTQPDAVGTSTLSKKDKYFFSVSDSEAGTEMEKVFSNIAKEIMQAATDVTVEDKITDEYTMIFDIPTGSKTISGVSNDFYIEFGKYALDENHERTTFTSTTKLYIQNTNGTLSAKDAAAPTFKQKTIGEKGTLYYWTTDSSYASKAAVTYTSGTTTYYFYPYGIKATDEGYDSAKWFNMTSGAYADGTVDSTTNMSENLVIATPYFVYNAATKMIYWTVDKLDTEECVLRYFLYLDNSATEVGTSKETDPGSYPTNDHAYITYTNFNGNDCRQEFPQPQLTWSGAQVSYVFYLVNAAGQPINKSGQVVDFANATFVTDVYTEKTVWNKDSQGNITADSQLSQQWLANELLPADYKVYDEGAEYKLHVYGNHDGTSNFDYFVINGNDAATISSSLNSRVEGAGTTASTVSLTTTKVYNTKAGRKITGYGTYTSEATNEINNEIVLTDIDFYNTTVAFAVVWQPKLVPDVVVVDYGLDVLINVVQNDILQNKVSGIGVGNSAYGNIAMNTGVSQEAKLGTAALTIDGNTISIENENAVRFHQNDMEFEEPVVFYYESPVEFWEGSSSKEGYMHSSVTVIPATTIYYEDSFVTLESYTVTKNEDGTFTSTKDTTSKWVPEGTTTSATQDQDRPGASQISAALDADNNYGYDSAYTSMSTYSMGSAAKITVDENTRGEATFTFYGTGFDIIGLTSNASGTMTIKVYSGATASGDPVKTTAVDTFYGYIFEPKDMNADGSISDGEGEWVVSENNPNTLYQVPVMKITGLGYGQYTVKLTAGYSEYFDHIEGSTDYDLYLDAIRIYDPTGNQNDTANNAYVADGEGWPQYIELRDNIIEASHFTVTRNEKDGTLSVSGSGTNLEGAIFIDCSDATTSIADYVSYGPNNELYLAAGQSVAFKLDQANADIIADVQIAMKLGNGSTVSYKMCNAGTDGAESNTVTGTLTTATDLYYSIKDLASGTIVISNNGGGILSVTNIKVTYTQDPSANNELMTTRLFVNEEVATAAVMSLRTASVDEEATTAPETSEPETSEPETSEPETSEPETSEPESTVPEETLPENDREQVEEAVKEAVETVINTVKNVLKNLFSRWFR